jgi:hypothetical protein
MNVRPLNPGDIESQLAEIYPPESVRSAAYRTDADGMKVSPETLGFTSTRQRRMKGKNLCSGCGNPRDRGKQRYCRKCHAANMRKWRAGGA